MRVFHKLILGFLSIVLLIWSVGYFAVRVGRTLLIETIGESSVLLARETLDKTDRHINHRVEDLRSYSRSLTLRNTLAAENQRFEELDSVQKYMREKDREWISTPKGELTPLMQQVLNNTLSEELKEKQKFHIETHGRTIFAEVFVTNKHGAIIASTGRTTDYMQADEQWYQQTVKAEGVWIGNLEYDKSAGVFAVDVVTNVFNDNGNFTGVIKGVLNVEELIHIVKEAAEQAKHTDAELKLMARDGMLVYSSEEGGENAFGTPYELFPMFKCKKEKTSIAHACSEVHARGEGHKEYFVADGDVPGEGKELIAHVHSAGYAGYKGLGWILVVEHDLETIFVPVTRLRNGIVIASTAATILAILLSFFISRSISNPLATLSAAAVKIGKGDLDTGISIGSNDEIGRLARSFVGMTENLRATTVSRDALTKEVTERRGIEKELKGNRKALEEQAARLEASLKEAIKSREVLVSMLDDNNQAREDLEKSRASLEEALKELRDTQEQIVQQERLGALGQMASGIAHDFNNELQPILGFSELLLTRPEGMEDREKVKHYLEMINTAAKDAAGVVSRLREFYRRREEGDAFTSVNLNRLVEQSVSLTKTKWRDEALAEGRHIEFQVDPSDIPLVFASEGQIRQVLMNLIINAVDAMPEGGTITAGTRLDGERVALRVSDTGTGMSEDVRRRCLEPFYTTKGASGTGLGLSVIYGIINRHDGTIDVESAEGEGTTFTIRFPVGRPEEVKASSAKAVDLSHKWRILVVDDDPLVREVVTEYLSGDGHTVEAARDGREGLDMFSHERFDLVMTDRAMPGMSGDQVAAAVKDRGKNTPVIMLTGFGEIAKARGESPTGVDLIVSKPVEISVLRESIANVMQEGGAR